MFTNLEGFPEDWKENPDSFVKFVREHHVPSFLRMWRGTPLVTGDEIKKALRLEGCVLRQCSTRCSNWAPTWVSNDVDLAAVGDCDASTDGALSVNQ